MLLSRRGKGGHCTAGAAKLDDAQTGTAREEQLASQSWNWKWASPGDSQRVDP